MKKTIIVSVLLLGLLVLAGCGTNVVDSTTGDLTPEQQAKLIQEMEEIDDDEVSFEELDKLSDYQEYEDDNGKPDLNLVLAEASGFNPVLYPLKHGKIKPAKSVDVNVITAGYTEAELFTFSTRGMPTLGVLSGVNIANAANQGIMFKNLGPYYREVVGPAGFSVGQVVALKDSDINEYKDFEGKRIGYQGPTDGSTLLMQTALRLNGVDLSKIEWVTTESLLAIQLMENGELDGAMLDSDFIVSSDFDTKYKTIIDFGKVLSDEFGNTPPSKFFVANTEKYNANPKIYDEALDYFSRGLDWSKEHMEEIVQLEADATGEDFDYLLMKTDYDERLGDITEGDKLAWKAILETAKSEGVMDTIPDVNVIFG